MLIKELLSKNNKKSGSVSLFKHSLDVAEKSYELVKLVIDDSIDENSSIIEEVYFASLFHDIGKCSNKFQEYLKSGNKDYIFHNVLGGNIIQNYLSFPNDKVKKRMVKSVLYHHPISNECEKMEIGDEYETYKAVVFELLNMFYEKFPKSEINPSLSNISDEEVGECRVPFYYGDDSLQIRELANNETRFFIISNILKFADYIVSSGDDYERIVNRSNFIDYGEIKKPSHYDNRFEAQQKYAEILKNNGNANIFDCQTGFGKTMLGILYSLAVNNKKTFWICPRNTIASGVYSTIVKEIEALNLSDKLSVGLLLTNEWKEGTSDSDIIVTNIDNFMRPTMKNDALSRTYMMLHSNLIFDEFHEYVTDAPLMAFFDIINKTKNYLNTNILYLSATPILNFFNKNIKTIKHEDEKILNKKYKVVFADNINDIDFKGKNYFVSINSVRKAQEIMENGNVDRLIHTRYVDGDMTRITDILREEHGNKNALCNTSWSATNIISTGIDISFDNICVLSPIAERFVQSVGRCNRWNDEKDEHTIIISKHTTKDKSEHKAMSEIYDNELCSLFYNMLRDNLKDGEYIKFKTLYELRDKFYVKHATEFKKYFETKKAESYYNIKNIKYQFVQAFEEDENENLTLGKNVLRGTTDQFYCKFEDCDELFVGNKIILPKLFDKSMDSSDMKVIVNYIFSKIKGNKDYFNHKKQLERLERKGYSYIMEILLNKARNSKTPLHIPPSFYRYDAEYGVVKAF